MKKIIVALSVFIITSCAIHKKVQATKNESGHLVGYAIKKDFQQEPYGSKWFTGRYNNYKTDKEIIENLKLYLKDVEIKGFMGTWCGDSKREIPHFYRILEEANFNQKNVSLITVNRQKTAQGLEKGYDLLRVPTFIFYKNGKEIGRFVEHTVNNATLEHDLLQIVSGKPYKHAYE